MHQALLSLSVDISEMLLSQVAIGTPHPDVDLPSVD